MDDSCLWSRVVDDAEARASILALRLPGPCRPACVRTCLLLASSCVPVCATASVNPLEEKGAHWPASRRELHPPRSHRGPSRHLSFVVCCMLPVFTRAERKRNGRGQINRKLIKRDAALRRLSNKYWGNPAVVLCSKEWGASVTL